MTTSDNALNGWTGKPCPKCSGTGECDRMPSCPACGGTGEENVPLDPFQHLMTTVAQGGKRPPWWASWDHVYFVDSERFNEVVRWANKHYMTDEEVAARNAVAVDHGLFSGVVVRFGAGRFQSNSTAV